MAVSTSSKLEWAIVQMGGDVNWWVKEISDEVHWDTEALGILDPKQISYIVDMTEALRDYGFDPDLLENAFFTFAISKELADGRVELKRLRESMLGNEEPLFALPDILDDEKGPYADFLESITKCRVELLNDLIKFDQVLTVDDAEEDIKEAQDAETADGGMIHFFKEITSVLEYIPDGFVLEGDEDDDGPKKKDDLEGFPEIEVEEKIVEDETMKWDEDEERKEAEEDLLPGEGGETFLDEDGEEEEEEAPSKPKRGRPKKKG